MTPLDRSLDVCARAEDACLTLLAQTDPYGQSQWDVAHWEELLERMADLHARGAVLRARLEQHRATYYHAVPGPERPPR